MNQRTIDSAITQACLQYEREIGEEYKAKERNRVVFARLDRMYESVKACAQELLCRKLDEKVLADIDNTLDIINLTNKFYYHNKL